MEASSLIVQDLTDMLEINRERVNEFNNGAYGCEDIPLKMLLNRELDNARDLILGIKRLLQDRFEITSKQNINGQLFRIWSDFKPSLTGSDLALQLLFFERTDLLTLHCYGLVIARSYVDTVSKRLLEFQYQSTFSIYTSLKSFRKMYVVM